MPALLTTNTWLGVRVVSEKIEIVPVAEAASTFPVTVPSEANGLFWDPIFAGVIEMAATSLPMKTLSPARSDSNEVGEDGSGVPLPGTGLLVGTLYIAVAHLRGGVKAHPLLVATTVVDDVAPVTNPLTEPGPGTRGWPASCSSDA